MSAVVCPMVHRGLFVRREKRLVVPIVHREEADRLLRLEQVCPVGQFSRLGHPLRGPGDRLDLKRRLAERAQVDPLVVVCRHVLVDWNARCLYFPIELVSVVLLAAPVLTPLRNEAVALADR